MASAGCRLKNWILFLKGDRQGGQADKAQRILRRRRWRWPGINSLWAKLPYPVLAVEEATCYHQ